MDEFDFYISSNGRLIIPDYDINYLVNMQASSFPSMPEAEDTSVQIAGRDGEIVLSTTYKSLNFNIVCYTDDDLTQDEKNAEEKKMNMFLNSIRDNVKKFALQSTEKFYEVKYTGSLTCTKYPKHLEFSIPLKSSSSYGFAFNKKSIIGNATAESNTVKECGAIFTINGPALAPIISLNDYSMEFSENILEGAKLIIDGNKSTVTHITSTGYKTNMMQYYNHQFPKIQVGTNELKVLSGIDDETQVKAEWYDLTL